MGVAYHSHLGEVDQPVLGIVGGALLDEGQVCQVHAQVGNARWVTAEEDSHGQRVREEALTHTHICMY